MYVTNKLLFSLFLKNSVSGHPNNTLHPLKQESVYLVGLEQIYRNIDFTHPVEIRGVSDIFHAQRGNISHVFCAVKFTPMCCNFGCSSASAANLREILHSSYLRPTRENSIRSVGARFSVFSPDENNFRFSGLFFYLFLSGPMCHDVGVV